MQRYSHYSDARELAPEVLAKRTAILLVQVKHLRADVVRWRSRRMNSYRNDQDWKLVCGWQHRIMERALGGRITDVVDQMAALGALPTENDWLRNQLVEDKNVEGIIFLERLLVMRLNALQSLMGQAKAGSTQAAHEA